MTARIDKRRARKLFREGKPFVICPCKFYPSGPFNLAMIIHSSKYLEEGWTFERMYNNWEFYNCSYETGYYAHFYIL